MSAPWEPWIARFERLLDDEIIKNKVRCKPPVLLDLERLAPLAAEDLIRTELKKIYLPTKQDCTILRGLLERAIGFCIDRYRDERTYLEALYDRRKIPVRPDARAVCLTGPGGCGKSELIHAMDRLLNDQTYADIGSGHKPILLHPYWKHDFRWQPSLVKTLSGFAYGPDSMLSRGDVSDLKDQARWRAFRDGTALMAADECQFISMGASANTKITSTLISLLSVDIPFLYVGNYSLIHLLKRRAQQERDRLLSDPIVMMPELAGTDDWCEFVQECKRVAGKWLKIDKNDGELHAFSCGIRRAFVDLLCISYRLMRKSGAKTADISTIVKAYGSVAFSEHRRDVERLLSYPPTSELLPEDLRCPFDLQVPHTELYQNGVRRQQQDIANAIVESSLTAAEKKVREEMHGRDITIPESTKEKRQRRGPVTPDEYGASMQQARSALTRKKVRD